MSRQNIFKILFLSLIFSSCGLIEKWSSPEQPTDSKTTNNEAESSSDPDDLFSKTMNETKEQSEANGTSDDPSNMATANSEDADLSSLENEFATDSSKTEENIANVEESSPVIMAEESPVVAHSEIISQDAGKVMDYKVQKGETLMQIAFKIYGDTGKWKELKNMNQSQFVKTSALRANMNLKYKAPEKVFEWNPGGTPHLIKNGETLGTISNSFYQTPKRWKQIWENNKPLIKNPNVIYAGFTLYVKGDGLTNYVQPKNEQKKIVEVQTSLSHKKSELKIDEEVQVEQAIAQFEKANPDEIDLTKEILSAPIRNIDDEIPVEEMKEASAEASAEESISR